MGHKDVGVHEAGLEELLDEGGALFRGDELRELSHETGRLRTDLLNLCQAGGVMDRALHRVPERAEEPVNSVTDLLDQERLVRLFPGVKGLEILLHRHDESDALLAGDRVEAPVSNPVLPQFLKAGEHVKCPGAERGLHNTHRLENVDREKAAHVRDYDLADVDRDVHGRLLSGATPSRGVVEHLEEHVLEALDCGRLPEVSHQGLELGKHDVVTTRETGRLEELGDLLLVGEGVGHGWARIVVGLGRGLNTSRRCQPSSFGLCLYWVCEL